MKRSRRGPINDKRYSVCSYPFDQLDWSNWFMDAWHEDAWRYIHVYDLEHDSIQRVRPRLRKGETKARMACVDGVLMWLFDKE